MPTPFTVAALVLFVMASGGCRSTGPDAGPSDGWRAGASSRSVLPTVNGTHAYADPAGLPLDIDATDPGVFVEQFDQGPITVGNGKDGAHWVRDDLRVRALALQRGGTPKVVVIVATDLYMMLAPDVDDLRARVHAVLPEDARDHVDVLVAATHNHHGPDTAFHVNPEWYEFMLDQTRDAVREAVARLEPATLRAAEGTHYFGASDLNGLRVYDPTLGALQARASDGRVIATLVQWANHPESTLNWSPPRDLIAGACGTLKWTGAACDATGRYLTADFPGVLARSLGRRIGGEVLYVNGAIGAMASPLGVPAWEIDVRAPVGNGYSIPEGAQPPGGSGSAYDVRNFRKAVLIGEQLGQAVESLLPNAVPLAATQLETREEPFFTRMSNIGFRKLAVVTESGRSGLGYRPGALYTCPPAGPKTAARCTDDQRVTEEDAIVGPIRTGDHARTSVTLLRIDELSMLWLPGEVPGELVIGLPADVRAEPTRWQDETPERHTAVAQMEIPGYVKRIMPGRFRWVVGLGNDELGYILPIADYRVKCVADQLSGAGACARLHAVGLIDFADGVAGARCKAIADRPRDDSGADAGPTGAAPHEAVLASCRYGQALGEAAGHYEETNSVGWDAAQDMFDAVVRLTGRDDRTMVNDQFRGYWHKYPPPPTP